ncbi:MAG: CDP-alcohol phosphatidyltransferase family protein [Myxococcales bacterium]|nr:CDP-alcohol phosphatidyltransferase family protein [Polyangiaceae bacterium]MDW8248150.1 CDP-alcohol phosphatidyltransferase family protein [Myxococcales bacterium]
MGFWDAYRSSLKSPEVEEPVDYWLHRPLGYVVARLSYPTPLSPNAITVGAILLGWTAAACLWLDFPYHMQVGALLILASTVFDCADGQLARMRKSSSVLGRMLDGAADGLVLLGVVPATAYRIWLRYQDPPWFGYMVIGFTILTVVTSGWHTLVYDYYKNVWMHFTSDGYKEAETHAIIKARHEQVAPTLNPVIRFASQLYVFHSKTQEDVLRAFDPAISLDKLPPRTPETEAVYRFHQARPWALNRALFGVGSLMIGLTLSNALDRADLYLLFRLVILNLLFFAVLRPMQRRATQATFTAWGDLKSSAE